MINIVGIIFFVFRIRIMKEKLDTLFFIVILLDLF